MRRILSSDYVSVNTCFTVLILYTISAAVNLSLADDYPSEPVTIVVGFGVGGSVDRMTRAMSSYLAKELGQPVQVINKKGAGTLLAANYVLSKPHDGYTIFASAFSPYLTNTILEGNAEYGIDDFAYVNFQWFDEDLIALHKHAKYQNLAELLQTIRDKPKTVRASVVRGSGGHLVAKLLLEINGIPQQNLNLVTYNSGGQARAAVAGGVVDFIIISAKGSESIREYIRPLAIVSDQASSAWHVPTLNDALKPRGIQAPILPGSIRGFATSAQFKRDYPQRFATIVESMKRSLANSQLKALLQQADIGQRWVGPENSTALMRSTFKTVENYSYLLDM